VNSQITAIWCGAWHSIDKSSAVSDRHKRKYQAQYKALHLLCSYHSNGIVKHCEEWDQRAKRPPTAHMGPPNGDGERNIPNLMHRE